MWLLYLTYRLDFELPITQEQTLKKLNINNSKPNYKCFTWGIGQAVRQL
jgi:hypothetical protein